MSGTKEPVVMEILEGPGLMELLFSLAKGKEYPAQLALRSESGTCQYSITLASLEVIDRATETFRISGVSLERRPITGELMENSDVEGEYSCNSQEEIKGELRVSGGFIKVATA